MYTLDQQLKDVDKAIETLKQLNDRGYSLYLCSTASKISKNFLSFLQRSFKRMEKISPKAYKAAISNPNKFGDDTTKLSPALWGGHDYGSRLQFLNDLKEDIIENG